VSNLQQTVVEVVPMAVDLTKPLDRPQYDGDTIPAERKRFKIEIKIWFQSKHISNWFCFKLKKNRTEIIKISRLKTKNVFIEICVCEILMISRLILTKLSKSTFGQHVPGVLASEAPGIIKQSYKVPFPVFLYPQHEVA
jgi:hypothetical protein